MTAFSKDNQPAKNGRKKGSRNKRSLIPDRVQGEALKQLETAVNSGEQWAVAAVLDRVMPKLKPIATSTEKELLIAQAELTRLKCVEISELEERIKALEQASQ